MPFIDRRAQKKLRDFRETRGLSPETMALEITALRLPQGTVDPYTIRRAERGFVPSVRSRYVLSRFFDLIPADIWEQDSWVKVDANQKVAA